MKTQRDGGHERVSFLARRPGYSLEQSFYTSAEIFERDLERIYRRHWLLAGPTCRIPRRGDYFRYEIAHDSIIVLRDDAGEVRAFHNVCRHRGSRICLERDGSARTLLCPYHAWSYDLSGRLKSARHLPPDVDRGELNLWPVATCVVEGLVFVCLADEPPDFSTTASDIREFFQPHRLDRTRVCHQITETIRANWKVAVENFWECYHCAPTHPEFCTVMSYCHAQNHEGLAAENAAFERTWSGETARRGLKVGTVPARPGQLHRGGRLPIRPGYATQSREGRPVAPLLGDYTEYDGGITSFMHLPLIWYVAANDYAFLTRFTPMSPLETELEMTWLVHQDAVAGRDYDPEQVIWLWKATAEQDKTICENNQLGILSSRYRPGPYTAAEAAVEEFVTWYLDELARP